MDDLICTQEYISTGCLLTFSGCYCVYSGSGQDFTYTCDNDLNYNFEHYTGSNITGDYCQDYYVGESGLSYSNGLIYCNGTFLYNQYNYINLPNSLSGIISYNEIISNGLISGCFTGQSNYINSGCVISIYTGSGFLSDLYTGSGITGDYYYNYYSNGSGEYYFTGNYCSGTLYNCGDLLITFPDNVSSNNGYYYTYFDGSGSLYTLSYYCNSGDNIRHLELQDITGNYCLDYYSNGNDTYYDCGSIYFYGTELCRIERYLNGYNIGYYGECADGFGSRSCSENWLPNGTYLGGSSINLSGYKIGDSYDSSDGNGSYYTQYNYCYNGFVFDEYDLNICILNCSYCAGTYCLISNGNGALNDSYNYAQSGNLYVEKDINFNSPFFTGCLGHEAYYANGIGSFYDESHYIESGCSVFCSGLFICIDENNYRIGTSGICSDGAGSVIYYQNKCASGYIIFDEIYKDIIFDGSTGYYYTHSDGYFSDGYYLSGQLNCASGVYLTKDTSQWSYFDGSTGIPIVLQNNTPSTGITGSGNFWITFDNGSAILANGPYSNGYYLSGILTGINYACHIVSIDNCDKYIYDLDNGSVLANSEIYSGFIFKNKIAINTCFQDYCTGFENGYYDIISNGLGSIFSGNFIYCYSGYEFAKINADYILSDGVGYFYTCLDEEFHKNKTSCVQITWDFDETTKTKYFCAICCTGDIYLDINASKLFYELSSDSESGNIYLQQIVNCCAITCTNTNPFIYIKNIGQNNLLLNSAFSGNQIICYDDLKILGCVNFTNSNYVLKNNENIILSLETSQDGSCYITNGYYPFGFFYQFNNVSQYNESGLFPACCFEYSGEIINTYIYENLCNFDLKDSSIFSSKYNQIRSFGFSGYVDKCIDLSIDFNKSIEVNDDEFISQKILNDYSFCSLFGYDFVCNNIKINYVKICDSDSLFYCCENLDNFKFTKTIQSDLCVNVIYNFDFKEVLYKDYSYSYLDLSGACSTHLIDLYSCSSFLCLCSFCIENSIICDLKIPCDCYLVANILLEDCNGISKIKINDFDRDNLFLPSKNNFDYDYQYILCDSNYLSPIAQSGFWANEYPIYNSKNISCFEIVNYAEDLYTGRVAKLRNLCFDFSENKTSTCSCACKDENSISETYLINYETYQKSFFYCGIEFKYFPIKNIYLNEVEYNIPDKTIQLKVESNNRCIFFDFPIQALNADKLKIISNYSIMESVDSINLNLDYNNFQYSFTCCNSNTFNFKSPQLITGESYEVENPCISAIIKNKFILEKTLDFYVNPFENFIYNETYNLNSLLLFITSELNSGIIYDYFSTAPTCTGYICLYEDIYQKQYGNGIPFSGTTYLYSGGNEICENCYAPNQVISGLNVCFIGCCLDSVVYNCFKLSGCAYSYFNNTTGFFEKYNYNHIQNNKFWILNGNDPSTFIPSENNFNDYILNLKSELNCVNYNLSGLSDNDCLFLFIEIENEFFENYENKPTGCRNYYIPTTSWQLSSEYNYCCNYIYNSVFPFKIYENGYNYILPINTSFNYCDLTLTQDEYGFHLNNTTEDSCFSICGILNYKNSSKIYSGGGFDFINNEYLCCDYVLTNNSQTDIFIHNSSLDAFDACTTKIIKLSRDYVYSGIQPFKIVSDYPLVDISYPIVCNNLSLFCECVLDSCISGIYYYIYGFNGTQNPKIKFVSPDFTYFNCIIYTDDKLEESLISITSKNRSAGIIMSNIAQVNLQTDMLTKSNSCYYSDNNNYICINIGGSL